MNSRGVEILRAMAATAPIPVKVTQTYRGECDILMTYGIGHSGRRASWKQHRAKGGRCIGWDLGYWNREKPDAAMRCTLDTDHPPQWLRDEPADRWDATGMALREDAGDGPVILVGQGIKSVRVTKERPLEWETRMLAKLKGRDVVFRPKRPEDPSPRGVRAVREGNIGDALKGASLVVCRHSNVAVDACIAGIPVVCESGAASAIYGSDPCSITPVTRNQRLNFLRSLAWWNHRPSQASQAWTYLLGRIVGG